MDASHFAFLAFLGGVFALDGASVAQLMISRPLVAGALAGWVAGDPVTGLSVGVLMELMLLPVFPVGGGRFPESGPATVAGVAAGIQAGGGAAGLAFGVLVSIVGAQLGGATVVLLRRANGRLVPDPTRGPTTASRVVRTHATGILMDFARGTVLVGVVAGLAVLLAGWARASWPLGRDATEGLLMVGIAVSLGALLRALGGWGRRKLLFLTGLGVGLAVAGFLG